MPTAYTCIQTEKNEMFEERAKPAIAFLLPKIGLQNGQPGEMLNSAPHRSRLF